MGLNKSILATIPIPTTWTSHDNWIYVIMYKLYIFRYTLSNIICIYLYINLIIHNFKYTILININAYNNIIYIYIEPQPDLKTLKATSWRLPSFRHIHFINLSSGPLWGGSIVLRPLGCEKMMETWASSKHGRGIPSVTIHPQNAECQPETALTRSSSWECNRPTSKSCHGPNA